MYLKYKFIKDLQVDGGRGGLVVNARTPDPEVGFEPDSGRRVVSLSKTYLPPKVLVIPRNQWLCPNMTEKLFTGMLSIKPNQAKKQVDGLLSPEMPHLSRVMRKTTFCICENKDEDQ